MNTQNSVQQPAGNPIAHSSNTGLDPDQQAAVRHRGSNLLIIAGAGSGKTQTLTSRAISFLNEIPPENLMVVTFTKKAAAEISTRIASSVIGPASKNLNRAWIGTIHSVCWRMLMENGGLVGLQPNWSILDMADSERVMKIAAGPYGFREQNAVRNLYQLYSYSRNANMNWRELVNTPRFPNLGTPVNIEKAIVSYDRRCRRSNRVDFDDLQVLALRLLEKNPSIRKQYQDRFKVIMVDEYQDTNQVQSLFLKLLASPNNNITVVGDDAQSIYGFRAATVDNILNFERDFKAERVTIGFNYRSTPEIVAISNACIRNNRRQIPKEIHTENPSGAKPILYSGRSPADEAKYLVQSIKAKCQQGVGLDEMAVLFRATRLAAALELELKQANIPYVLVGGEDFFSLEHIKIILDMVRLLVNPEDSIALGAVQQLIGFSSEELLDTVEQKADLIQLSFWDMVNQTLTTTGKNAQQDLLSLLKFKDQIAKLRGLAKEGQSITPAISGIIDYLIPYLKPKYFSLWEEIEGDFSILQTIAAQYISLGDFINTVTLQQFVDTETHPDDKRLTLTTVHSAKGLEWNTVFVIGLVEFWFPLNYSIQQTGSDEEERRLFYVAITRAKKELFLTSYAQSVNQYGKSMPQNISRFISELPNHLYQRTNVV